MKSAVRRAGFSLIELLVVISGLAIAIGFGATLLLSIVRIDQMAAASLHRMMRHYEMADLFREDVSNAIEAPDQFAEFTASRQCLILRQPADTWVIYQFTSNKLQRIKRTADRESQRPIALASTDCQAEFDRGNKDQRLVTLRITEKKTSGFARHIDISAALKGELK
jgi:prepilin-type N-terminal cleavage/methylation domain-containing protein